MNRDDYPRCATCKWWDRYDGEGWGECALGEHKGFDPVHPDSLAYAADAENYEADLTTHETFGCVQHQPKGLPNEIDRDAR